MNYEKTRVIPTVESTIFEDNDEDQFAITGITPEDLASMAEFAGAAELRAKTYLEHGFVKEDELDENGTELDPDDERSAHFILFERTAVSSLARVVGNMRLIIKDEQNPAPLPVEDYFPDYFQDPASPKSAEVSRLIARHEDSRTQALLKWPLFIAGYKHVVEHDNSPVYGLLTPDLVRQLSVQGVPIETLHDARYIEQISSTKQPVEINLPALGELIDRTGDYGIDTSPGHVSYLDLSGHRGKRRT